MTQESGALTIGSAAASVLEAAASDDQIQLFDFSVDLLRAILWQYNDAKNMQGLLQAKADWYTTNQTEFWENWLVNVFNLKTANQFGLQVWAIILGLPLYVNAPPYPGQPTWGFAGSGDFNFDNGNFNDTTGGSIPLPLATQRRALQLRYLQLITAGCVPEVNRGLKWIFGDLGQVYLLDYHNMTQEYIFLFPVTFDLQYLFNNFDILPRPAGVLSMWEDATILHFGFAGSGGVNFNNGNFGD